MTDEKDKISKFYNDYKIINFNDQSELKKNKDILKKQMEGLVNVVLPSLVKLGETNSDMPVGMMLASLVSDNYVKKDKFIDVQNNLKEMKELAGILNLDKKLVVILGVLVP